MAATLPARRVHDDRRARPAQPAPATRRRPAARPPARAAQRSVHSTRHVAPEARRAKQAVAPTPRRQLRLVNRPRMAINAALMLVGVIVSLMLATVVLHTRLAERQLDIDRLETSVTEARARFDVLRQQRAELRSPTRLAAASVEMGMAAAPPAEFLPVDPFTVAEVLVASGPADEDGLGSLDGAFEPLDQVRRVKAAAAAEGEP